MSYNCAYIVIDKTKLVSIPNYNLLRGETKLESELQVIEAATVLDYCPEDNKGVFNWAIPELAAVHNISYEEYLNEEQIKNLLATLDTEKIKSLLPDSKKAKVEALIEIESFIQLLRDGLATGAFDTEDIEITAWQQYAVPLFEAHGIAIYTRLSKSNVEKLLENLNDAALYDAVSKAAAIDILGKEEERLIVETLTHLKAIYNKLQESPNHTLLYYDDYEQEHFPKEVLHKYLQK